MAHSGLMTTSRERMTYTDIARANAKEFPLVCHLVATGMASLVEKKKN